MADNKDTPQNDSQVPPVDPEKVEDVKSDEPAAKKPRIEDSESSTLENQDKKSEEAVESQEKPTEATNGQAKEAESEKKEESGDKPAAEANGQEKEGDESADTKSTPVENGKEKETEKKDDDNSSEKKSSATENGEAKNKTSQESSNENGSYDPHKLKQVPEKCKECDYICLTDAEMKIHCQTSHTGPPSRFLKCGNCKFHCTNTWEMDYHCRSRGHKAQTMITCKKCDFLCETKDEANAHRRAHIPPDKLMECGDCNWVGDRLDNMRYHEHSQEHKPKIDYEAIAKAKAEAQGAAAVKHYLAKLAKDIKKARTGRK